MRAPNRSIRMRLAQSRPPGLLWTGGAVCWSLAIALSLFLRFAMLERLNQSHLPLLICIYGLGAFLAWLVVLPLARFAGFDRHAETRFAACFLLLGLGTVAMTAFLFAMQYRLFYARWHAPPGTLTWAFQFVFTSAVAVYQFALFGVRLVFPFAFIFLLSASLYLARRQD